MHVSFLGNFPKSKSIQPHIHDAIREHLLGVAMPNDEFYKEGRWSEHRLEKEVENLTQPSKVDHELLADLNIKKFELIQDNAYRGQTLRYKKTYLAKLKAAGIKTIIDLWTDRDSSYQRACEANGLGYIHFPIADIDADFWNSCVFEDKARFIRNKVFLSGMKKAKAESLFASDSHRFIENFIEFISAIKKGNYYIGCELGTTNTTDALVFSEFFNPKDCQFIRLSTQPEYYDTDTKRRFNLEKTYKMYNLYRNLTQEDKLRLGWTAEFEEKFKAKMQEAINDANTKVLIDLA